MEHFGDIYSQYYDLLYQDKDYAREVNYVDNLIAKMQIINTRRNFGKETLYKLTLQDLEEAMEIFTQTKQSRNTDPPPGMYN